MIYLLRRRKLGKTSCKGIKVHSQTGIRVFRNDAPALPQADLVFRWGCTSNVPCNNIINKAQAIHLVSDKRAFRKILDEEGLSPRTWLALEEIEFPCVIRPSYHAQGRHLYFCRTEGEAQSAIARCGEKGFYASEFVPKVAEYRVFIVQGRAVWVAKKTPGNPEAIAWNVAQGGRFDNVRWKEWPLKTIKRSIEATALSGLDFGGVDAMVDAQGKVYILEINAAPSQTSDYRQRSTAKALDYIVLHGKANIPLIQEPGGYLKFVHPAIDPAAKVLV